MHGYGIYTWPDGKVYKGYYIEDLKDGEGYLLFINFCFNI
jgi:hypothetical protein